jgi:hypothetical protein
MTDGRVGIAAGVVVKSTKTTGSVVEAVVLNSSGASPMAVLSLPVAL